MAGITYGTTGGGHVVPLPGPFDRSEAAHHESGHAVARWALGLPFLRLNLDGLPCPMVEPLPGATIAAGPHMLIGACGLIGDYQKRGLSIRGSQIAKLLLGSPDGRWELDDAATGKVAHRLTNRAQAVAPGADLFQMAGRAQRQGWSAQQCIMMWRDCEHFIGACRPAVDAVAGAVLRQGQLSYDKVTELAAAAMVDHEAPVIPAWTVMGRPGRADP